MNKRMSPGGYVDKCEHGRWNAIKRTNTIILMEPRPYTHFWRIPDMAYCLLNDYFPKFKNLPPNGTLTHSKSVCLAYMTYSTGNNSIYPYSCAAVGYWPQMTGPGMNAWSKWGQSNSFHRDLEIGVRWSKFRSFGMGLFYHTPQEPETTDLEMHRDNQS